jgi:hypothetical protein
VLTVATTVFVGVVADGVVDKLAGIGAAASVVVAAGLATAVALFVPFYDTVAAGLAGEESDVPVVGETS